MPAATLTTSAAPLWAAYFRRRGERERNALAEHFMPLVEVSAKRYRFNVSGQAELDELIQWGTLGLMEAIAAFDPARGANFKTFSAQRIRGAMVDGLRAVAPRSRVTMDQSKKLHAAEEALRGELGREPAPHETAERIGKGFDEFHAIERRRHVHNESLDKVVNRDGDRLDDTLADPRSYDLTSRLFVEEVMNYVLANFRVTEALVLRLYYLDENSMAEVAKVLNLSAPRISQIHRNVMECVRSRFKRHAA